MRNSKLIAGLFLFLSMGAFIPNKQGLIKIGRKKEE
jgi:hypothetical protein